MCDWLVALFCNSNRSDQLKEHYGQISGKPTGGNV
jgi:hypothetical protein